jgi:hypothetical protein
MDPAVVQLAGSVLIWHMTERVLTACCLYGARSKNGNRPCYPAGALFFSELLGKDALTAQ